MKKSRISIAVLALFSAAMLTACSDEDQNKAAAAPEAAVTKAEEVEKDLKKEVDEVKKKAKEEKEKANEAAQDLAAETSEKADAADEKADDLEEKIKEIDEDIENTPEDETLSHKLKDGLEEVKEMGADAAEVTGDAIKGAAAKADKAIQDAIGKKATEETDIK